MSAAPHRVTAVGVLGTALAVLVSACGSGGNAAETTTTSTAKPGAKTVDMALVLPCPTSDPWCKQGFTAAKKLESEGLVKLKVTVGAPQDTAGVSQVIRQHAQAGQKLVIGWSTWQDATTPVAEKFAGTNFATFGAKPTANVALFDEPIYQASYLAGILAAGVTKTKVIGGVAAMDIPLCHAELAAFKAGATSVDPSIKQVDTYVGDWNDAAKSKQAVLGQIDQKVDVVLPCGGAQATGMAQAIKARNVSGFGYVGDTSSQAPKNIIGTVVYDPYPYFKKMVDDTAAGTFQPGKLYSVGLADGGVRLDLNPDYSAAQIPAEVKAKMDEAVAAIKSGKFTVPYVPTGKE